MKESRKDAAISILTMVVAGQIDDAFTTHVANGFIHHNPYFRGDTESLKTAMKENHVESPNKILEVQRCISEGDLVVVHSRIRQNADDPGAATVHIFRFSGDKIVETWDVAMPMPDAIINENGMF